jgi:hypothetical protein
MILTNNTRCANTHTLNAEDRRGISYSMGTQIRQPMDQLKVDIIKLDVEVWTQDRLE